MCTGLCSGRMTIQYSKKVQEIGPCSVEDFAGTEASDCQLIEKYTQAILAEKEQGKQKAQGISDWSRKEKKTNKLQRGGIKDSFTTNTKPGQTKLNLP